MCQQGVMELGSNQSPEPSLWRCGKQTDPLLAVKMPRAFRQFRGNVETSRKEILKFLLKGVWTVGCA